MMIPLQPVSRGSTVETHRAEHTENGLNGHAANGNGLNGHSAKGYGIAHGAIESTVERAAQRAGEITITRRLYRSGESEYLINGKLARFRDIQDLFLGTELGPESYAILNRAHRTDSQRQTARPPRGD